MFYNLVQDLVKLSKLDINEINKLKTKEYTKSLFPATDHPKMSSNRDDNIGNSSSKLYRLNPPNINGLDTYVPTQFFDSNRDAIIEWYKSHLKKLNKLSHTTLQKRRMNFHAHFQPFHPMHTVGCIFINCINIIFFIDPPYNTGNDFMYNDRFVRI